MAENTDEIIEMQPLMPENQTLNAQTITTSASKSIAIPNPTDEDENSNISYFSRCRQTKIQIPPKLIAILKILLDWITNFILPGVDEITDGISGVRYFINGDYAFGTATLVLPCLPAIVASLLFLKRKGQQNEKGDENENKEEVKNETCFRTFWSHLPVFQLWTHQKMLKQVAALQNSISFYQERINDSKKEAETEETKEDEMEILECQTKINAIKTDLQRFKILTAVLESAPQFILQCSILVKRIYANQDLEWNDPIFWLQTSSSIASVFLTFTGLTCEMPIVVYETERPPFRDLSYNYTKVLPLVIVGASPRLLTLVAFFSFVTIEDWYFYLPFVIVYGGFLVASSMAIKYWMKNYYPIIKTNSSISNLIDLGLITSIICPSVIGVFDSGFLFETSLITTMIHSLALASLSLFGFFQPEWVFNTAAAGLQDLSSNDTETGLLLSKEKENHYEILFGYLRWYTFILVPTLLLFSNFIAWGIQKVFMTMNDFYMAVCACDGDRIAMVQDRPSISNKLNDLVPADKDDNMLIHYCSQRNDEVSAHLLTNCDDLELDLSQTNTKGKTALMMACDKAHPKTVECIFNKASEGIKIGVNKKSFRESDYNSALHFAALSNWPIEGKKEIIYLFWSFAKELKINLLIKNRDGKTPIHILEESQEGKSWLQEFGNPIEDLNLIHPLKKAIEDKDIDQVEFLKNKIIMHLNFSIFHAIKENEEVAIELIDNCQRLTLSLSETNEVKETPLILACALGKPKIANAILCQAKTQDIAINATDMFGKTAFLSACARGLTSIVAMMLEMAQQLKIDLNEKGNNKMTGFIYACESKHSEVIDLIMAKAESLQIDLQCKDKDGKYGFDHFPGHFHKEELNFLKKHIDEKDFERALSIKRNLPQPIKNFPLYHAMEADEEVAIALVDNSQRLNLSLSDTHDKYRTPLILACWLKKPKIANSILCQAKAQDIAINAKDFIGYTAFILACVNGLTDIVAMMLEMAQEVKINLNAKDDWKKTGFIWACQNKHSGVIDLIMAKAESLQIDLQCKDDEGKSGFDIFPEHFKK